MENNSTMSSARLKKIPPPPLSLPATTTNHDEDKRVPSSQQNEEKINSANSSCSSSSSSECSHKPNPFVLPTSQRPQILETLTNSSSSLLVAPPYENKQKKSCSSAYTSQVNLFRERRNLSKVTATDSEWINFMRLVVNKSLTSELRALLDKYKTTYFDRVNAPGTSDEMIRSSLCEMVNEALSTYSQSPTSTGKDDSVKGNFSPPSTISIPNHNNAKRKRKTTNSNGSSSSSINLTNQSKFVMSYSMSGQSDNLSARNSQLQRPKKTHRLFRYVPNEEEQAYLICHGHLKSNLISPSHPNFCLMLYDEVAQTLDDYDLEMHVISLDEPFTVPESIIENMSSSLS